MIKERPEENYLKLIQKLENPESRAEIVREQKERDLRIIIKEKGNWIRLKFNKEIFLLDKEGLQIFNEGFNIKGYSLCLFHSKHGDYLARSKNSTGKEELFHRFIMKKEIELFQLERGIEFEEIVIHHDNFKKWDNRKINLIPMTKKEHEIIHGR